ncbi:bifunctional hydroxymethylpyrimidine kinase/phosphomethylpyrimidine kinase [Solimonas marina]|uniref:hydroxymethylpyrimidine kinase n=1 Tax=Solimonas marina TaxID=2714601 RepID=A0A969W7P7_9GAMM|nr:hydroxymethylpyrimidine/phosphomethylpyrimidine kinase [Solimonas marina]NKF22226.1 hydroxymethylpyrimidine/phosphomethylpyrimidine kinase [Solimonas marina]
MLTSRPRVLCLSGHDPSGGAGIHADLEAIAAQGAHALTVITALTVQDSGNVRRVLPQPPAQVAEQVELLLADGPVAAVKIGLIGDAALLPVLVDVIRRAGVPAICDPVLRAGGGTDLSDANLRAGLIEQLLPQLALLTPNAAEARRLMPDAPDLPAAAARLAAAGCRQVLITGGDEPGLDIQNLWRDGAGTLHTLRSPRIDARFHGAGCTLAAAIAGRIAVGDDWGQAIARAQDYTHGTLAAAYAAGQGRLIPKRHLT